MKPLLVAVMTAGLSGGAFAQTMSEPMSEPASPPANDYVETEDITMVEKFGLTTEQLEDAKIRSTSGEQVGEIEEVLMTRDGEITAITAEVGGFLGIGDKEVIIPLDRIEREGADGAVFIVDMSEEEIEGLPEWDD